MKKNIPLLIVVVLLIGLGLYWWYDRLQTTAFESGAVVSRDGNSPSSKARMDSGAVDIDGRPSTDTYTASTSASSGNPRPLVTAAPTSMPTPVVPQAQTVASNLPGTDTLQADAPSGMAFGGNGKFQWYRQGNLTWRINTQSGITCVAFATMDEWAKPLVYSHGCGNA